MGRVKVGSVWLWGALRVIALVGSDGLGAFRVSQNQVLPGMAVILCFEDQVFGVQQLKQQQPQRQR